MHEEGVAVKSSCARHNRRCEKMKNPLCSSRATSSIMRSIHDPCSPRKEVFHATATPASWSSASPDTAPSSCKYIAHARAAAPSDVKKSAPPRRRKKSRRRIPRWLKLLIAIILLPPVCCVLVNLFILATTTGNMATPDELADADADCIVVLGRRDRARRHAEPDPR